MSKLVVQFNQMLHAHDYLKGLASTTQSTGKQWRIELLKWAKTSRITVLNCTGATQWQIVALLWVEPGSPFEKWCTRNTWKLATPYPAIIFQNGRYVTSPSLGCFARQGWEGWRTKWNLGYKVIFFLGLGKQAFSSHIVLLLVHTGLR